MNTLTLIHSTYFPSISHFSAMMQAGKIVFEVEDNFQKQTNRNRTYIYSPNGIQLLNIPVKHTKLEHQKTKDVQIEPDFDWQNNISNPWKQHIEVHLFLNILKMIFGLCLKRNTSF